MATFTSDQITTLENLKSLSTHVVNILDKEATIASELRQLTSENITALNTLYGEIVTLLTSTITPA